MNKNKVVIGFITYGQSTFKYLPDFLLSLKEQTFSDFRLIALDNSEIDDNKNFQYLSNYDSSLKIIRPGRNLGFGGGFNLLIKEAVRLEAKYFLALNVDVVLDSRALALLVERLDKSASLGSVSPKILKWDFVNNEFTKIIDTCGLKLLSGLKFVDLGQTEVDQRQYDDAEILGPSGCAGLYRLSALEQIKYDQQEYFDENFFMYKEDCDLAYRLALANWPSALVSSAVIYHDRTATSTGRLIKNLFVGRRRKNNQIKAWSFLNQHLLIFKYWSKQSFFNKILIIGREILMLGYITFFEAYLWRQLKVFLRLRNKLKTS